MGPFANDLNWLSHIYDTFLCFHITPFTVVCVDKGNNNTGTGTMEEGGKFEGGKVDGKDDSERSDDGWKKKGVRR